MNTLKLIRNIGIPVIAIAAIAGIIAFTAMHSNNTVNAHGPDHGTTPVMAGTLDHDTPVFPVAQVPVATVSNEL